MMDPDEHAGQTDTATTMMQVESCEWRRKFQDGDYHTCDEAEPLLAMLKPCELEMLTDAASIMMTGRFVDRSSAHNEKQQAQRSPGRWQGLLMY